MNRAKERNEWIKGMLGQERRQGLALLVPDATVRLRLASELGRSAIHAGIAEEVRMEADGMLTEEEPELTEALFRIYAETGDRLSYERVYFRKRKRLAAFGIMSFLEPESTVYAEALQSTLQSICDEDTWCLPAHYREGAGEANIDLFAAETGFALAELLALHEETIPAPLRMRVAEEVERRLFQPFLGHAEFEWEKADNNWSAVCAGSIGAAALYRIDDTERLAALLDRVLAAMDCFLTGYGQDGACAEGYLYWQYGFGYYVYFTALLKSASFGRIDGFANPKVKAIALFQQRCFSSGNTVVNFSDALPQSGIFMGLSYRLKQEYEEVAIPAESLRAPYNADHCGRWAPAIRNLLWVTATDEEEGRATCSEVSEGSGGSMLEWPSESHYMEDVQWLISRYVPASGAVYCFAAKGGHNAEPHNHNDLGHFMLHADGEAYLADLGSGMYSADYFGPNRYSFWCNGSQGHSTPIIGHHYQESGSSFRARVLAAEMGERSDRFRLELGGAYSEDAGIDKLERSFIWSKEEPPVLTLCDKAELASARAAEGRPGTDAADGTPAPEAAFCERFITLAKPEIAEPGLIVIKLSHELHIRYDGRLWQAEATERRDIDHFGKARCWYTLDFTPLMELDSTAPSIEFCAEFKFQ